MTAGVPQRGVVIFNPTSGRGLGGRVAAQARELLGDAFQWWPTARAGHAVDLAREAAGQFEVVVACGGDGTVGDVLRGLMSARESLSGTGEQLTARNSPLAPRNDPVLGIIPVGTGNDVARNLGIRLTVADACRVIQTGTPRAIDVGLRDNTPFINNVGTGFDAAVMQRMNSSVRFLRGQPAFLYAILRTLPSYQPARYRLRVDDQHPRELSAFMVSVVNGVNLGGGLQAAPGAQLDDGQFDVLIIKALSKWKLLPLVSSIRHGRHVGHPGIELFRARSLHLETDSPQPVNIDGEIRGTTPMSLSICPQAIRVLAPAPS